MFNVLRIMKQIEAYPNISGYIHTLISIKMLVSEIPLSKDKHRGLLSWFSNQNVR